jgi:hypothetical protein
MQAVTFLSLIYLALVSVYQAVQACLSFYSLLFAAPILLAYIALSFGLLKVGKANLLMYVPLFLTFDSALQLAIFLETRIRHREERKWVKLAEGKYYHVGTEIRMH